jgi:hypothetical protein
MTWAVRTADDPRAATSYARAAITAVDPKLGISDIATMDQVVADSTSDRRLNMLLFALLGSLALALATVGVYGVVPTRCRSARTKSACAWRSAPNPETWCA